LASGNSSEGYDSDYADGTASGSDDDGAGKRTSNDQKKMGREGQAFTKADLRVAAEHLASFPNRDELSKSEIWVPFNEKVGAMGRLSDVS
jgi:hypothetical protein